MKTECKTVSETKKQTLQYLTKLSKIFYLKNISWGVKYVCRTLIFYGFWNAWLGTVELCLIRHCLGWQESKCALIWSTACWASVTLCWMNELNQLFPLDFFRFILLFLLSRLISLLNSWKHHINQKNICFSSHSKQSTCFFTEILEKNTSYTNLLTLFAR